MSLSQRRVLLVMSASSRQAILHCLDELGVRTFATTSCAEAQELLRDDPSPPVVVSGISLDGGNWGQLLKFVVDHDIQTNIVIAAPRADESFWSEALWRGVHDLLVEPFEASHVGRVLDSAVRSCQEGDGRFLGPL